MASRQKRMNSWREAQKNVARAKVFMERFDVHVAQPINYLPSGGGTFDDLLKQIDKGGHNAGEDKGPTGR